MSKKLFSDLHVDMDMFLPDKNYSVLADMRASYEKVSHEKTVSSAFQNIFSIYIKKIKSSI